jgi:phosphinothricin acetyltransferase
MNIRYATASDAAAIADIYRPLVTDSPISFELEPPGAREMAARVRKVQPFAPWLVCEIAGRVVGFAYAARHHEREAYKWCVDSSVYIDEAYRGRGIGKALYTSLFALLRMQGFVCVYAGIVLGNGGSVRMHESLGFRPVGVYREVGFKAGRWHDVGWWELPLGERPAVPRQLLTPAEIQTLPGFEAALRAGELLAR